jgi:hypothetical protein
MFFFLNSFHNFRYILSGHTKSDLFVFFHNVVLYTVFYRIIYRFFKLYSIFLIFPDFIYKKTVIIKCFAYKLIRILTTKHTNRTEGTAYLRYIHERIISVRGFI